MLYLYDFTSIFSLYICIFNYTVVCVFLLEVREFNLRRQCSLVEEKVSARSTRVFMVIFISAFLGARVGLIL